jgi:hypothetical protein
MKTSNVPIKKEFGHLLDDNLEQVLANVREIGCKPKQVGVSGGFSGGKIH